MDRLCFILFFVFATLISATASAQGSGTELTIRSGAEVSQLLEGERPVRWVPGEVIIKYRTTPSPAAEVRLRGLGLSEHVRETGGGAYIYSLPEATIRGLSPPDAADRARTAVEEMSSMADVEYVQLNYILDIVRTPNDGGYPLQWHYFNNGTGAGESPGGIGLPDAWDTTVGSPSVVIAVIDTGILPNHQDIAGSTNVTPGFDMISSVARANDGDGRDSDPTDTGDGNTAGQCGPGSPPSGDSWHGTHVAGTVGVGNSDNNIGVAGVNWNTRVMALRALGRCGGSTADINDSIRWAAGLPVPGAPNNPNPARVINMSLGAGAPCSASPSTQAAINDAVAAGATIVVAAGNEAQDASNSFPASCNNVIAVAASDYNGDLVTRYSNFGAAVDIMAPGGDLQADENNDGNPDGVLSMVQGGYAFFNGTSMAAPHVAGAVGLLLAQEPSLTPAQVEARVKSTARPRNSQQCPQPCGAGLLNANFQAGPPPPPLSLTVTPNDFSVDEGDTITLQATVSRGGSPLAGKTVRFQSLDTTLATVSPATATTNAGGMASATVTGVARGSTRVAVSVQDQTQTANVDVQVRVADALGRIAIVLLLLLIGVFGYRRLTAATAG